MSRPEWLVAASVALVLGGLAAVWVRARRPSSIHRSRHSLVNVPEAVPAPARPPRSSRALPDELRWTSGTADRPSISLAPEDVAPGGVPRSSWGGPGSGGGSTSGAGRALGAASVVGGGGAVPGGVSSAGHSSAGGGPVAAGGPVSGGTTHSRGTVAGRISRWLVAHPRFAVLVASTVGLCVGEVVGGPVAAIAVAVYAAVAVLAWRLHAVRARSERAFTALLDAIDAVTGDLRAGLAPTQSAPYRLGVTAGSAPRGTTYSTATYGTATYGAATSGASTGARRQPFDQDVRPGQDRAIDAAIARLDAAYRISEALGAPLADLLDRVDADLRADRGLRSSVRAQTAGAQATSVLLAALPFVGLAMGAGIGAHPLRELLHTRLGAACALVALALQCAGLGWTARMVRGATR